MIIPIRCFTCNNKIANKWELYTELLEIEKKRKKNEDVPDENILTTDIITKIKNNEDEDNKYSSIGLVLNKLGLTRYCCRRHFIGHIELIEYI